jgi:hypothetical protein
MKTMYKTPLALAVVALFGTPLAFAYGGDNGDNGHDGTANVTVVKLTKEVKVKKDVEFKGQVDVDGNISIDSSAMAIVDDKHHNFGNYGKNRLLNNTATVGDDALQSATGNIGLNVVAGDNNQQANAAALAATDAGFVFGSADAEVFAQQMAMGNTTKNYGVTNLASFGGNALQNASGNIGVNIAAGNSNQQKNDLAASVAVSRMAEASVAVKQMSAGNTTKNKPDEFTQHIFSEGRADISLSGKYAGIADQNGNQYPDTWSGDSHPGGSPTGHIDLDTAVQGASDRPQHAALGADGVPTGPTSTGGGLSFNEEGDLALSGTASWSSHTWFTVWKSTTNTASLSGNALQNASGNIGVNIAAGTNNQQYNGLAIAVAQAPRNGSGNGE